MVALSSLATEMASLLEDTYYAGIWKRTLPHGLLWQVDRQQQIRDVALNRRVKAYKSPSWSWTSMDAPVSMWQTKPSRGFNLWATTIKDVTLTPENFAHPHGPIDSGTIEISGPLLRLRVVSQDSFRSDGSRVSPISSWPLGLISVNESVFKARNPTAWFFIDEGRDIPRSNIFTFVCLPIRSREESKALSPLQDRGVTRPTTKATLEGLILRPTYLGRGEYVRVGHFTMMTHGRLSEDILSVFKAGSKWSYSIPPTKMSVEKFTEDDYVDSDGRGNYTVCIV